MRHLLCLNAQQSLSYASKKQLCGCIFVSFFPLSRSGSHSQMIESVVFEQSGELKAGEMHTAVRADLFNMRCFYQTAANKCFSLTKKVYNWPLLDFEEFLKRKERRRQ